MFEIRENELTIIVSKDRPERFLVEIKLALVRAIHRTVKGEDIFFEAEAINDMESLLLLLVELSPTENQLKKLLDKGEKLKGKKKANEK